MPLTSGRFLALLGIELIVVSMLVVAAWGTIKVNGEFINERKYLTDLRQQIQGLIGQLNKRTESAQNPETTSHLIGNYCGYAATEKSVAHLVESSSLELPKESTDLKNSYKQLKQMCQEEGISGHRYDEITSDRRMSAAIDGFSHALTAMQNSTDWLNDANFERFSIIHSMRFVTIGLGACTWLLALISFGGGVRIYRRLSKEHGARLNVENELIAERNALEKRVQTRTAALEEEVKERQRAERLNRGRNHALEMLARNEPAAEILKVLAETVAEYRSTWVCVLHTFEDGPLRLVASTSDNEMLTQHLQTIKMEMSDAPESITITTGKPHIIKDLGVERKPWCELLRANGLISVWSAPLLASKSGKLGTLSVYTRLKWSLTPSDIEMLEMACNMAALVLERSKLQTQLMEHAYYDSLTGLPNRRLGIDRLSTATERATRSNSSVAVLWIDLDRFKQVNDVYGHPVGDALLQEVGERLTSRLRASDTLARMGGDEFMAVLECIHEREEAEKMANDLLKLLSEPVKIGALELSITASIGVAMYPDDGVTVDGLAQHADQAMYAAKFGGHGILSYTSEMDRGPAERREFEAELSQAIGTDAFSIAYQPLCLPDGVLVGFEALLRFESPRLGNVTPSKFIPIAEEAGLIIPIGKWVLREVCRQHRVWMKAGHPSVSVSVNISASQFAQDDFAETVEEILSETGVDGERLALELTESTVMRDIAESARQMDRLKRLGVRIAVDDFGTGYSSLSYLHRLPIDVLKIDRSFMETLNKPDGTRPIIEAVLSMAHTLGMTVVAEGVETAEQLKTLDQCGCDVIQGYFFSRPVVAERAAVILEAGKLVAYGNAAVSITSAGSDKENLIKAAA